MWPFNRKKKQNTTIELGPEDAALIVRGVGVCEVALPVQEDGAIACRAAVAIAGLAIALHDDDIQRQLSDKLSQATALTN